MNKKFIIILLFMLSISFNVFAFEADNSNEGLLSGKTVETILHSMKNLDDSMTKYIERYTTDYIEIEAKNNISSNKVWRITFNKPLSYEKLDMNSIRVIDSSGEEVHITLKINDNNENELLIFPPKEGYLEDTYCLIVLKDIQNVKEKFKKFKLKEEQVMYFTVVDNNDINIDEPNNNEETLDIFKNAQDQPLEKQTLGHRIKVEGKKLSMENDKDGVYYPIGDTVTSDLNDRLYNLIKYYLENNEKKNYIYGGYLKTEVDTDGVIKLLESRMNKATIFEVNFADTVRMDWSYNSNFWIHIYKFSDSKTGYNSEQDYFYTQYYIDRFKETLKIILQDKDYEAITQYVMGKYDKYIDARNNNYYFDDIEIIDEVEIKAIRENDGRFYVYFKF